MATILNNEQSTIGSPYAFYTVEVTTSGRTADSISCAVTVKSHLQYDVSLLGTGYTVTGYIGLNGTEYSITLKSSSASWSGTTVYTATKTVNVTGLSETQTIVPATFRVVSSADSAGLSSTECSNLVIPYYTAPEQTPAPALADTSGIATPYIFTGGAWVVTSANV